LLSPDGHSRRGCCLRYGHCAFTFLRPFAPRALPRFHATTDALTAARHSPPDSSPCFTSPRLPDLPSPTTAPRPTVAFCSCHFSAVDLLPLGCLVASSPVRTTALDFALGPQARHSAQPNRVRRLQPVSSFPVALHLFSRTRSYGSLHAQQAGVGRTSTALMRRACTRTGRRHLAGILKRAGWSRLRLPSHRAMAGKPRLRRPRAGAPGRRPKGETPRAFVARRPPRVICFAAMNCYR
jgi:hypothetical protein